MIYSEILGTSLGEVFCTFIAVVEHGKRNEA